MPAALLLLPLGQNAKTSKDGKQKPKNESTKQEQLKPGALIVRPFLTNYRGAMLIATVIAILAVDFNVFPRRFAKVETWGTSLMDLGVGSFVFSAGIVSSRVVIRGQQNKGSVKNVGLASRMLQALRHSLPLLVLGIIRLISVKNLEYAEHVTEYGVHWNFFFTLALLPPFVEAIDSCLAAVLPTSSLASTKSIRYDVIALLISVVYEVILDNTRLLPFIVIAPRTPDSDLLTKNREGIFSFFGYLAVFLLGRSSGVLSCQLQAVDERQLAKFRKFSSAFLEAQTVTEERSRVILPALLLRAAAFAAMYLLCTSVYTFSLTVSRRLGNLPYVLWIAAFNNTQLFLFGLVEAMGPRFVFSRNFSQQELESASALKSEDVSTPVMRAFNKNGLAIFLVANLCTGLVNLTVNTLDMSDTGAMGILISYAGVVTSVGVALHRSGVNIKI